MKHTAQHLASMGRNNDSMLVHMSPNEVRGLQALAMSQGGSLTVNPYTGLPEAGFLESVLPIVLGIGGSMVGIPPWLTAAAVGGIQTARTGDLGQGIMAGLSAYGGASLGSALSATGGGAALPAAGAEAAGAAGATTPAAAAINPLTGASTYGAAGAPAAAGAGASSPFIQSVGAGTVAPGSSAAAQMGATSSSALPQGVSFAPSDIGARAQSMGRGIGSLAEKGGFDRFGTAFSDAAGGKLGSFAATTGLTAPITGLGSSLYEQPKFPQEEKVDYKGPYTPSEREVSFPTDRDLADTSEYSYFSPFNPVPGYVRYAAEGGKMTDRSLKTPGADYVAGQTPEFNYNFQPVEVVKRPPPAPVPGPRFTIFGQKLTDTPDGREGLNLAGLLSSVLHKKKDQPQDNLSGYQYDPATQQLKPMAQGGLAALNAFSGGRFLQGAGDGVSDSIPAMIGRSQPARLADGEFVVDARTVSELGNGSSKAGAQKLYAMMERVHSARKKAKRGKDSHAEKYLPA